ncbi:MAG: hypothetical protein AAGF79_07250 [Pseudomonadota bacterium]
MIYVGSGDDVVRGGAGTNILCGNGGRDHVVGSDGTDELFGGKGRDVRDSGIAPDFLNGGPGNEPLTVTGGDQTSDTFIFEDTLGHDTITDFEVGFDEIFVAAEGIDTGDVTSAVVMGTDDVRISVDIGIGEDQTILVEGVADTFVQETDVLVA